MPPSPQRWISRPLPLALALVAAAALWTWVYGRFGHNALDDGFVVGLAWRLVQGELPHRDFIYVRPPGSIFLHAIPLMLLPARWVMLAERFLFFASIATASGVASVYLHRRLGLAALGVDRALLALTAFVASAPGFPPMAWHTVDGILLGSIGLALLGATTGLASAGLIFGGMVVGAAALCKQSFYFLIPIAFAGVWLARGWRASALAAAGVAATAAGLLGLLVYWDALAEFIAQTASASRPASLWHSGVGMWGIAAVKLGLPTLAVCAAVYAYGRWRQRPVPRAIYAWIVLAAMWGPAIVHTARAPHFVAPLWNYPALPALAALIGLAFERGAEARQRIAALLPMLGLAWCAGLSWGYPTPALFAAPGLAGALAVAGRRLGVRTEPLLWTALGLALTLQTLAYRHPYREAPRAQLVVDLGTIEPRLSAIRGSERGAALLTELRELTERHGAPFALLPGRPAVHYLHETRSPIAIDWAINIETAGQTDRLWQQLLANAAIVLIERDSPFVCESGPLCSRLAVRVQSRWRRVESGDFFDVYVAPDRGSEAW